MYTFIYIYIYTQITYKHIFFPVSCGLRPLPSDWKSPLGQELEMWREMDPNTMGDGPKYQGTNIAPDWGTIFLKGIASSNHQFGSTGRDGSLFLESPPKINS